MASKCTSVAMWQCWPRRYSFINRRSLVVRWDKSGIECYMGATVASEIRITLYWMTANARTKCNLDAHGFIRTQPRMHANE